MMSKLAVLERIEEHLGEISKMLVAQRSVVTSVDKPVEAFSVSLIEEIKEALAPEHLVAQPGFYGTVSSPFLETTNEHLVS